MSWEIKINTNYKETSEYCLQLCHTKKNQSFRSWFGPLAHHIYLQLKRQFNFVKEQHKLSVDKQLAQYVLMQASFLHQRCLYQFQVTHDLTNHHLSKRYEVAELLLFIRMTHQHPSHHTLLACAQSQIPWCIETDEAIKSLLDSKLIQKIECIDHIFYDKNPYPHDHVLDTSDYKLNDFTSAHQLNNNERLILSSINNY